MSSPPCDVVPVQMLGRGRPDGPLRLAFERQVKPGTGLSENAKEAALCQPAPYVTWNVPATDAVAPPSEHVTVAVEVPAPVLVPTVHVQETPPEEPATSWG